MNSITQMETKLCDIDDSKGVEIPNELLKTLGFQKDEKLIARTQNGSLIISTARKKKYDLDEMIAQCELSAPMPAELELWNNFHPVGAEISS